MDIVNLVASLREAGSDDDAYEVKRAAEGLPECLADTMSAFANRPGGGVIVLGLDERTGFAPTGVYDLVVCQQSLVNIARQSLDPAVQVVTEVVPFEGVQLVIASVRESPTVDKPVRVRRTGRAFVRQFDGDYPMSEQEEQLFAAPRGQPRFDLDIVPGATVADLSADMLAAYLRQQRATALVLAELPDREILVRTGVLNGDGGVTLAGLLALGVYPQQFVPNFAIQASVTPGAAASKQIRALDSRSITGPIPAMLDEAMAWVMRNSRARIAFDPDGHGRDLYEYPSVVARELIANALIHRDLSLHARSTPVSMRLESSQLIISNPGGLFGLSVESLGRTTSHCRNAHLMQIVQQVRTKDGLRVVERLGSGIPAVLDALREAGMTPPYFHDQGIKFAVRVPNHALMAPEDLEWVAGLTRGMQLTDIQRHVLVAMRDGQTWTNRGLREVYPMDSREAHRALQGLVDLGLAEAVGDRGQRVYTRSGGGRGTATPTPPLGGNDEDGLSVNALSLLQALEPGERTVRELVADTRLSDRQVRWALARLRQGGHVEMRGSRGRTTTYRRVE